MNEAERRAITLAEQLRSALPVRYLPPSEGTRPRSEMVLPHSLVRNTRGYLERIAYQVNGCYIIEVFESRGLSGKIKKPSGDFFLLADLVAATLSEATWNLGRKTKQALPRLKDLGDQSAHSRRFVAVREDVDKVQADFRLVVQELIFLANLK